MEDENARMAAMQADFQETIAKLREDLTTRLRVEEAANRKMREEAAKREATNRESDEEASEGKVVGHILRRARWW